jgi:hypothetical protein
MEAVKTRVVENRNISERDALQSLVAHLRKIAEGRGFRVDAQSGFGRVRLSCFKGKKMYYVIDISIAAGRGWLVEQWVAKSATGEMLEAIGIHNFNQLFERYSSIRSALSNRVRLPMEMEGLVLDAFKRRLVA